MGRQGKGKKGKGEGRRQPEIRNARDSPRQNEEDGVDGEKDGSEWQRGDVATSTNRKGKLDGDHKMRMRSAAR